MRLVNLHCEKIVSFITSMNCTETGMTITNKSERPRELRIENPQTITEAEHILKSEGSIVMIGGSLESWPDPIKTFIDRHPHGGILLLCADPFPKGHDHTHQDSHRSLSVLPVEPSRLVIAGSRIRNPTSHVFLTKQGIQSFPMTVITDEGLPDVTFAIMEWCRRFPDLLVIIDMAVVDPAFAPDVLATNPGGLSGRELIHLIQKISLLSTIRSAWVCGIMAEPQPATASLAAAVIVEMMGGITGKNPN